MDLEKLKQDIEAYKQSEQEAREIIAELKHTLDCKNGTIETLKAENKELAHYLACMTEQRNKANTRLQEIKAIAKREIIYIDFRKSKSCAELEQDYARINYELEQKIFEIIQKITKAEEQWK